MRVAQTSLPALSDPRWHPSARSAQSAVQFRSDSTAEAADSRRSQTTRFRFRRFAPWRLGARPHPRIAEPLFRAKAPRREGNALAFKSPLPLLPPVRCPDPSASSAPFRSERDLPQKGARRCKNYDRFSWVWCVPRWSSGSGIQSTLQEATEGPETGEATPSSRMSTENAARAPRLQEISGPNPFTADHADGRGSDGTMWNSGNQDAGPTYQGDRARGCERQRADSRVAASVSERPSGVTRCGPRCRTNRSSSPIQRARGANPRGMGQVARSSRGLLAASTTGCL